MMDSNDLETANISASAADHWKRSQTNLKRLNVRTIDTVIPADRLLFTGSGGLLKEVRRETNRRETKDCIILV